MTKDVKLNYFLILFHVVKAIVQPSFVKNLEPNSKQTTFTVENLRRGK